MSWSATHMSSRIRTGWWSGSSFTIGPRRMVVVTWEAAATKISWFGAMQRSEPWCSARWNAVNPASSASLTRSRRSRNSRSSACRGCSRCGRRCRRSEQARRRILSNSRRRRTKEPVVPRGRLPGEGSKREHGSDEALPAPPRTITRRPTVTAAASASGRGRRPAVRHRPEAGRSAGSGRAAPRRRRCRRRGRAAPPRATSGAWATGAGSVATPSGRCAARGSTAKTRRSRPAAVTPPAT